MFPSLQSFITAPTLKVCNRKHTYLVGHHWLFLPILSFPMPRFLSRLSTSSQVPFCFRFPPPHRHLYVPRTSEHRKLILHGFYGAEASALLNQVLCLGCHGLKSNVRQGFFHTLRKLRVLFQGHVVVANLVLTGLWSSCHCSLPGISRISGTLNF